MKTNAKLFNEAFQIVAKALSPRSPKEVYQYVHAVAESGTLTLTGTNGGLTVKRSLSCEGSLPPSLLPVRVGEIAKLSSDWIEITGENSRLIVSSPLGRNTLSTRTADDYPLPDEVKGQEVKIAAAAWELAGKFAVACVDPSSMRFAMQGVHLSRQEGVLEIAATDGRRLATVQAGDIGEMAPVTVMAEVFGCISGDVTATLGDKMAAFRCGDSEVWCRVYEGRFPNYVQAGAGATDGADNEVTIPVEPLLNAVKLATVTTSEESSGINLTFGGGVLLVESAAADKGESRSEIPVACDAPAKLCLDSKLLIEFLKRVQTGQSVTMWYGDSSGVQFDYGPVKTILMTLVSGE